METLGFKYSFLICAASMTTNIAIGFAFTPPAEEDDESLESELTEDEKTERSPSTISLKVESMYYSAFISLAVVVAWAALRKPMPGSYCGIYRTYPLIL